MSAKSNFLDQGYLALVFNGTPIANLAENASTSPLTNLYVALHTATPGATGNQQTNEAAYTGYARVAVPRTTSGFTVTGGSVSLASTASFPTATGGSETETYFSVGTAASGAGNILYFGPISPSIPVQVNATPQLLSGTTITES